MISSHIFDLLYDRSLVRIDFKKRAQAVQARSSLFEAVGLASYTGNNGQCPLRPSTPLPAPQPLPEGYYACGWVQMVQVQIGIRVGWSCFAARFVAQVVRKNCSRPEQAGNLTAKVAPPPPRPLLLFITNVKNARTVWVLTLAWAARIATASTCEDMQNNFLTLQKYILIL